MKVIVQNGSNHELSRAIVERALAAIPRAWEDKVQQVVICAATAKRPQVLFHEKERSIAVYGPCEENVTPILEELLAALSIISERGHLPFPISSTLRAEHAPIAGAVLVKAGLQP